MPSREGWGAGGGLGVGRDKTKSEMRFHLRYVGATDLLPFALVISLERWVKRSEELPNEELRHLGRDKYSFLL